MAWIHPHRAEELQHAGEQALTTSSMMGSGLAASSWSLTLSSTTNKLVSVSQQCASAKDQSGAGGMSGWFPSVRRLVDD